jgi:RNA polymerase sigma factor (sigma-70 family)
VEKAARKVASRRVEFDDLRQEGVVGVLEYLRDHPGERPTDELLFVVALRRMINFARRMNLRSASVRLTPRDAARLTRPGPAEPTAALDLAHAFAVAALTPREHQAIDLVGRLETPLVESAGAMGVSRSTLIRLLDRSKEKLQGGLGPAYGEWTKKHPCRYVGRRSMLNYHRYRTEARHRDDEPSPPLKDA